MTRLSLIYAILLISCGGNKGFDVPGNGNQNGSNQGDDSGDNESSISCPDTWTQEGQIWLDPVECVAWSSKSASMTWHQAISPNEAQNGGCNDFCDAETAENHCADLEIEGISNWKLPTITEIENLATRSPPFADLDADLWSINSDAVDTLAWTGNFYQPGMSVLLQKSSQANVRCIAK